VPKVDGVDYLAFTEVDHSQRASVRAGHADSRVAVDRYECPLAIGRCGDLVPSHASLGDGRNLPCSSRINETEGLITFIGDEQQSVRWR
jgi:hypothetical protein